ncbi:bifunctional precorrin-2 dehydrogenase/sirohydrochlorin ferrochelatase [uncultured Megasphaera sp.]|uniref:precorrin-2 dehydrogenase/sirohydrochlorin ferrochelatase family protein n=1 Tax=uncultured Megasphaera sp. TaxID=165188 RepID=UPI002803E86F|nr:bifunctional precorrin-2 dehydrogenase/sirohydrochlorin ferrochelatase [uncultured Megasphaera sp.]
MYPINLDINGQPCLVIGGGRVAERKVRGLLAEKGAVTVIAPSLTPGLEELAAAKALTLHCRTYEDGDEKPFFLILCATDDRALNERVAAAARREGKLLNVCDVPDLCNFTLPSIVRQGDLELTISTNGQAPALSRWLRRHLEKRFDERWSRGLTMLSRIRQEARTSLPTSKDRQDFWRQALTDDIVELIEKDDLLQAESRLSAHLAVWERKTHET